MDTSIASLNRSTFEERQKNVSYLRSLYFLLAVQLLVAVGWCLLVINYEGLGDFVKRYWVIALITGILCSIIALAVYFVPALNNGGGAGMGVYAGFTILAAYTWGYFCSQNKSENYAWFVLILLTAIAIGFAAYTW